MANTSMNGSAAAGEEEDQRHTQNPGDRPQSLHTEVRSAGEHQPDEHEHGREGDHSGIQGEPEDGFPQTSEPAERLGERDHVERHGNGLGHVEADPDGAPDGAAERPRDDEVLSTSLHPPVRRDLRDGEGGGDGHRVSEQNDDQDPEQSYVANRIPETQEHDGPEDRADAGQEDGAGAEAVTPGCIVLG
jgi:hypothetical protein